MSALSIGQMTGLSDYEDVRTLGQPKGKEQTEESFSSRVSDEKGKMRRLLGGLMKNMGNVSALSGGDSTQAMTDFARMSVDLLGMERDIKNQETQEKIAGSLEKQVGTQEAVLAAQMIGRSTDAEISTLTLEEGKDKPKITYDMPAGQQMATVVVRDIQDKVVYMEPLTDLTPGKGRSYTWEAMNYVFEDGEWSKQAAPNGTYKISILGETKDGKEVRLPTFSQKPISWVKLPNQETTRVALGVGGQELSFDQIRTLHEHVA